MKLGSLDKEMTFAFSKQQRLELSGIRKTHTSHLTKLHKQQSLDPHI